MDWEDRALLASANLFQELQGDQIDAIAAATELVWFDSGDVITQVGEPGAAAFITLSGALTLADAATPENLEEPLGPGTLVGELAMLTEVSYAATVVAAEPVRALAITREALYQVMEADPSIAEHFSAQLIHRLSSLAEDLRGVDDRFEALETTLARAPDAA